MVYLRRLAALEARITCFIGDSYRVSHKYKTMDKPLKSIGTALHLIYAWRPYSSVQ